MTRLSKLIVQLSLSLESASLFIACTLVPTVFRWHGKMEFTFHFHFRFSFSYDIEKQIWISFFVFTSLWKTHLNFVFRFCFRILDFEKGIWISFFVFTSLWKTDLNFVFVWLVIWKTDLNFVCHWKSRQTPSRLTGEFTFYAKESNWIWPRGQSEWWTPPSPWYSPHTLYSFFNKGWQIIWW